jgi:hypothetical protein
MDWIGAVWFEWMESCRTGYEDTLDRWGAIIYEISKKLSDIGMYPFPHTGGFGDV